MANEVRLIDADRTCFELERFYNGYTGELRRVASEALDLVCMMPTIDPESLRSKGRWVTDDKGVTYCGNCRIIDDYASVHNYCPNCGAKTEW